MPRGSAVAAGWTRTSSVRAGSFSAASLSSIAPGDGAGGGVGDEEDPVGPAQAALGPGVPLGTRVEEEVAGPVLELAERDVDGEAQGAGERSLGRAAPSVAFVEAGRVESERLPEGAEAFGESSSEGGRRGGGRQREDRRT